MSVQAYRYARFGPIASVLSLQNAKLAAAASGSVQVQMAFAPIHRSDAAIISGTVPVKKEKDFPRTGGFEGVGTVIGDAEGLKKGQQVWLYSPDGTWTEKVTVPASNCCPVKATGVVGLPLLSMSGLFITAHRLFHGFEKVQSGETIVQNGGSSLTSQIVTAIAASKGVNVVTAIAPGPRFADAKKRHEKLGATVVEYNSLGARQAAKKVGNNGARLFLNGVGGRYYNDFSKTCGAEGHVITYGAQHGAGMMYAVAPTAFKQLTYSGFYLPRYLKETAPLARNSVIEDVAGILEKAKFDFPVTSASFDKLPEAWDTMYLGGGKTVLAFKK